MHHLMLHLILVPLTNPIRLCIPVGGMPQTSLVSAVCVTFYVVPVSYQNLHCST